MEGLVSVIMPVYNAEEFVEEAIRSILEQTYDKFELIIVDDCSTDKSMDIVRSIKDDRIRIIKNEHNCGVAHSRNIALDNSQGEFIAIMDDDDVALPCRFEMQVNYLNEHKDIDVVGGKHVFIDCNGEVIRGENKAYYNPQFLKAKFLFNNTFCNSEMMLRKSVLKDLRYSQDCYGMEDYKLWIQLSKYAPMTMIDEVFLKHRRHGSNLTMQVNSQKLQQRKEKYKELQELSWELSGIELSEQDKEIFHKYISEDGQEKCNPFKELTEFYEMLGNFLIQCKKLDFYDEIEILCKREFMAQMRRVSVLWEE